MHIGVQVLHDAQHSGNRNEAFSMLVMSLPDSVCTIKFRLERQEEQICVASMPTGLLAAHMAQYFMLEQVFRIAFSARHVSNCNH